MKTTIGLLALFILVLGGGYLWSQHSSNEYVQSASVTATSTISTTTDSTASSNDSSTAASTNANNDPGIGDASVPGQPDSGSYTIAQVSTHNKASNCWTAISGNVYDLTKWVGQHPGGEAAILSICGKDGTSMFKGQHGDDGRANAALANFKIGVLAS